MAKSTNRIVRNAMAAMRKAQAMCNARPKGQTGETRWVTIGHTPVLVDKDGNPVRDNAAATAARKREYPYEADASKWPRLPTQDQIESCPYKEFKSVTKQRLDNAVNKAWCEGADVPGAATVWYKERGKNGQTRTVQIDIDIGREDLNGIGGTGLMHIATDHDEAQIKKVSGILAWGKYYHDETESGAYLVTLGNDVLSLKPKPNGKFRIASCYEDPAKVAAYTRRGGQVLNMEVAEGEWTGGF